MGKYCVHGKTKPHVIRHTIVRYAGNLVESPSMTCIGPFVREQWDAAIIESERPERESKK